MEESMHIAKMPEDEAKRIFKTAYGQFSKKEYLECIKTLNYVFENYREIENDKLNFMSLMWGIAGDSLASLKSIDDAINAYRKSIEQDKYSGCIMGYAWLVAKYNIRNEMPFAYECLLKYQQHIRSGPRKWRIFGFIFSLIYMPKTWWSLYIRSILVRNKLRKMMHHASSNKHA